MSRMNNLPKELSTQQHHILNILEYISVAKKFNNEQPIANWNIKKITAQGWALKQTWAV
jgi:hypothetical protein